MVYLWIFIGLLIAIIGLTIANVILSKVKKKKLAEKEQEKGAN